MPRGHCGLIGLAQLKIIFVIWLWLTTVTQKKGQHYAAGWVVQPQSANKFGAEKHAMFLFTYTSRADHPPSFYMHNATKIQMRQHNKYYF